MLLPVLVICLVLVCAYLEYHKKMNMNNKIVICLICLVVLVLAITFINKYNNNNLENFMTVDDYILDMVSVGDDRLLSMYKSYVFELLKIDLVMKYYNDTTTTKKCNKENNIDNYRQCVLQNKDNDINNTINPINNTDLQTICDTYKTTCLQEKLFNETNQLLQDDTIIDYDNLQILNNNFDKDNFIKEIREELHDFKYQFSFYLDLKELVLEKLNNYKEIRNKESNYFAFCYNNIDNNDNNNFCLEIKKYLNTIKLDISQINQDVDSLINVLETPTPTVTPTPTGTPTPTVTPTPTGTPEFSSSSMTRNQYNELTDLLNHITNLSDEIKNNSELHNTQQASTTQNVYNNAHHRPSGYGIIDPKYWQPQLDRPRLCYPSQQKLPSYVYLSSTFSNLPLSDNGNMLTTEEFNNQGIGSMMPPFKYEEFESD